MKKCSIYSILVFCSIVCVMTSQSTFGSELPVDKLTDAIKNGKITTVAGLSKDTDINVKDKKGNSPLILSALYNQVAIAEMLLKNGADINARNCTGETALYIAACKGFDKLAYVLINNGADINSLDDRGYSPLMGAVRAQMEGVASTLIERGAKINICNDDGRTALHIAVEKGSERIVRMLLEKGADPDLRKNAPFSTGEAPLHTASETGNLAIVELLVSHGADMEARDNTMETPLFKAVRNMSREEFYLADGGKRKTSRIVENREALKAVRYLVEHGADINAKDADNYKLMNLVRYSDYETAKYLQKVYQERLGKNRVELFDTVIHFSNIKYSEGGEFWEGETAENCMLMINGIPAEMPKGTWIGRSISFILVPPKDVRIRVGENDILFAGEKPLYVSWNEGSGLMIEDGVPAKDIILAVGNIKIPFAAKRFDPEYAAYRGEASMGFYENGSIKEGWVSGHDFTLKLNGKDITFKGDEIMKFKEDGSISEGTLKHDVELTVGGRTLTFKGDDDASFYKGGNIRSATLTKEVALPVGKKELRFEKGWTISFYENGSVESGRPVDEIAIKVDGKVRLLEKQKLYFSRDGNLVSGYDYEYKKNDEADSSAVRIELPTASDDPEEETDSVELKTKVKKADKGRTDGPAIEKPAQSGQKKKVDRGTFHLSVVGPFEWKGKRDPIVGKKFKIMLPDGNIVEKVTDKEGIIEIYNLDPDGPCKILSDDPDMKYEGMKE